MEFSLLCKILKNEHIDMNEFIHILTSINIGLQYLNKIQMFYEHKHQLIPILLRYNLIDKREAKYPGAIRCFACMVRNYNHHSIEIYDAFRDAIFIFLVDNIYAMHNIKGYSSIMPDLNAIKDEFNEIMIDINRMTRKIHPGYEVEAAKYMLYMVYMHQWFESIMHNPIECYISRKSNGNYITHHTLDSCKSHVNFVKAERVLHEFRSLSDMKVILTNFISWFDD